MATHTASPPSTALRSNALGVGFIVFFVVSAAGPLAAIAGGLPIGMLLGNGAGIPALIVVVVAILLMFAAGYTAMARHVSKAGGFYSYIGQGFGPKAASAAAAVAILGYNAMQIGLYGLFGVAAQALAADLLGLAVPWWVWSFLALASIAVFGYRQVDLSAKVLGLVVAGEYFVVLLLDLFILTGAPAENITMEPFSWSAMMSGAPAIGILFCFASFVGFEATTIYSEEAKDPRRTIPLATYISVLLIGVFYAFSTWCLVVGAGAAGLVDRIAALPDPTLFTFTLSDEYAGPWLSLIMGVLFVTSVYAALLAFHNSTARYFYATGRDGLLPQVLGLTHPRHQSPHMGSILQTALAALVLAGFAAAQMDPVLTLFSWLTNLATLCIMVLMAMTSFAVISFFGRVPDPSVGVLRRKVLPLVSGVLLLGIFALAIANFDLLIGSDGMLSWALPALIPAVALLGLIRAGFIPAMTPARS